MNANEFYKKPPIRKSKDFWSLTCWFEFDECDDFTPNDDACPETERPFEIRYYIDHNFDHRRFLELVSIWWKEQPVAMCARGGREGRDYEEVSITDKDGWDEMVAWINSLNENADPEDPRVWGEDQELPLLETVYGRPVKAFYDPEGTEVNYEVGDIVKVRVEKNPYERNYSEDKEYVTTRCEILDIQPYNPLKTYKVKQLDRLRADWNPGLKREVIDKPGEGNIITFVSFHDVMGAWDE